MGIEADLSRALSSYASEVASEVSSQVKRAGTDCARYVRENAAEAFGAGTYSKGWKTRFEDGPDGPVATVYNAGRQASLGHLLEDGHEQFYMGRDLGYRYPGVKHVSPAFDRAVGELEGRLT